LSFTKKVKFKTHQEEFNVLKTHQEEFNVARGLTGFESAWYSSFGYGSSRDKIISLSFSFSKPKTIKLRHLLLP